MVTFVPPYLSSVFLLSAYLIFRKKKVILFQMSHNFLKFYDNSQFDFLQGKLKDSCDGSGLNTIESSKGSHPLSKWKSSDIVHLS